MPAYTLARKNGSRHKVGGIAYPQHIAIRLLSGFLVTLLLCIQGFHGTGKITRNFFLSLLIAFLFFESAPVYAAPGSIPATKVTIYLACGEYDPGCTRYSVLTDAVCSRLAPAGYSAFFIAQPPYVGFGGRYIGTCGISGLYVYGWVNATSGAIYDQSGGTCPAGYKYNFTTGMCDPNQLTITISGGTTTEPWHKKHDPEHTQANLPYKATVTDQNGQPQANVSVTITTDVTSDSGGHVHTNGRPKGKLVDQTGATVSTKDGKMTIPGTTDGSGVFAFTFGAEEASGTHTLTATCVGCKDPAKSTVKAEISGLMLLDENPLSYELRGSLDPHPGNHYFSQAAMVQIINLAHSYRVDKAFNKQLMKINDSSLIKGGTFDVLLDWTSESNVHGGHRLGIVVDINNYKTARNTLFEEFAFSSDIKANWHGKGTAPHYHLLLLNEDH
ncbi:MAG TPA: hypothetical protein VMV48_03320 [Gallionellaceae bacterium]|nr:hypothetical protein [Gallionellaceae bacterium]